MNKNFLQLNALVILLISSLLAVLSFQALEEDSCFKFSIRGQIESEAGYCSENNL